MIKTFVAGDVFSSTSPEAFSMHEKSNWGEKNGKRIDYSGVEVLYLVEQGKMEVFFREKEIDFDSLMKRLIAKDKKIETKYAVFRDLRKKGYIVKTALKFGAEFRVYDKGIKPGEDHAKWVVFPVHESGYLTWHDFSAKNRVAHSTKKHLLIGVVDDEESVTYYVCSWLRP